MWSATGLHTQHTIFFPCCETNENCWCWNNKIFFIISSFRKQKLNCCLTILYIIRTNSKLKDFNLIWFSDLLYDRIYYIELCVYVCDVGIRIWKSYRYRIYGYILISISCNLNLIIFVYFVWENCYI